MVTRDQLVAALVVWSSSATRPLAELLAEHRDLAFTLLFEFADQPSNPTRPDDLVTLLTEAAPAPAGHPPHDPSGARPPRWKWLGRFDRRHDPPGARAVILRTGSPFGALRTINTLGNARDLVYSRHRDRRTSVGSLTSRCEAG
jgi:hypothetical protein